MDVRLDLEIQPQPNEFTCGPTCLHAVYRYYGDDIPLEKVVNEVPSIHGGGTLAVLLACHALRRGYHAQIYSYNLNLFDPTWFELNSHEIRNRLKAQIQLKNNPKLRSATNAYMEFLERGGELLFEDLTKSLIRGYLNHAVPILTGLNATFLYRCAREFGPRSDYDDIRGVSMGHFVVLSGYHKAKRTVQVSDPLLPNPVSSQNKYEITMDRLICAILLGIVTYDANLLIIQPR